MELLYNVLNPVNNKMNKKYNPQGSPNDYFDYEFEDDPEDKTMASPKLPVGGDSSVPNPRPILAKGPNEFANRQIDALIDQDRITPEVAAILRHLNSEEGKDSFLREFSNNDLEQQKKLMATLRKAAQEIDSDKFTPEEKATLQAVQLSILGIYAFLVRLNHAKDQVDEATILPSEGIQLAIVKILDGNAKEVVKEPKKFGIDLNRWEKALEVFCDKLDIESLENLIQSLNRNYGHPEGRAILKVVKKLLKRDLITDDLKDKIELLVKYITWDIYTKWGGNDDYSYSAGQFAEEEEDLIDRMAKKKMLDSLLASGTAFHYKILSYKLRYGGYNFSEWEKIKIIAALSRGEGEDNEYRSRPILGIEKVFPKTWADFLENFDEYVEMLRTENPVYLKNLCLAKFIPEELRIKTIKYLYQKGEIAILAKVLRNSVDANISELFSGDSEHTAYLIEKFGRRELNGGSNFPETFIKKGIYRHFDDLEPGIRTLAYSRIKRDSPTIFEIAKTKIEKMEGVELAEFCTLLVWQIDYLLYLLSNKNLTRDNAQREELEEKINILIQILSNNFTRIKGKTPDEELEVDKAKGTLIEVFTVKAPYYILSEMDKNPELRSLHDRFKG